MKVVKRQLSGFTLIEMVVTITILAILVAIAAPSFRSIILNQRVKTASFDLFSSINYARSEAIKRNNNVELRAGASADGAWATGWRVVDSSNNILRSWGPVTNLSLTETSGQTASFLRFDVSGRLSSPAASPWLEINSSPSVTGVTPRCIQIDLSGRATTKMGVCS
jgi:type IV fimbrial biogenesis protein FimT